MGKLIADFGLKIGFEIQEAGCTPPPNFSGSTPKGVSPSRNLDHFENAQSFSRSLTIPCAICQPKDIMSLEVKESCLSCLSSFKDCALLILWTMQLSAFEKATLTWPMSLVPGSFCRRNHRQNKLRIGHF